MTEKDVPPKNPENHENIVTLIEDPFGIRTGEISRDQENPEFEDSSDFDDQGDLEEPTDIAPVAETADADTSATEKEAAKEAAPLDIEEPVNEDLLRDAHDWAPDAQETQAIEKAEVTLARADEIVTEAQHAIDEADAAVSTVSDDDNLDDIGEELDLASAEDTLEQLENLSRAMKEEEKKLESELETLAGENAAELAERLAQEIAEDQLLAEQMAKEAEAAEAMEEIDPELEAALPELDVNEIASCIETLLFLTDKPMSVAKLQEHLGPDYPLNAFQVAVTALKDRYQASHHGIEIVDVAGGLQFRTKPGRAALAKKLAKVQTQRLSGGALETLAIVAFRQPVLKDDIDKIRGVDSSYFVRGLMDRKLIEITGRSELPGRPMMYSTTSTFLELFGLKDLSQLPSLRELEQMVPASQTGKADGEEDPRVLQMRKMVQQMKSDTSTQLIYDHREDEQILKDIRERVQSIPTSTPTLDAEREAQKNAKALAEMQGAQTPEQAAAAMGLELPGMPESGAPQADMLQQAESEKLAAEAALAQAAAEAASVEADQQV